VVLGRQFNSDHGRYNLADPSADNCVSVSSSSGSVTFEPTTAPLYGMHGGFRAAIPMPAFRVEGADLQPGETVTLAYGDRSGGSRGPQAQTNQSDEVLHPIYVDLDGNGLFLTPSWEGYRIEGGQAVSLR
jgi:hypothetical protein